MSPVERSAFFAGILCGICVGMLFGFAMKNLRDNGLAVRHHAAHYDAVSGDFTWNDEEPTK